MAIKGSGKRSKKTSKKTITPTSGLLGAAARAISGRASQLAALERKAMGGK